MSATCTKSRQNSAKTNWRVTCIKKPTKNGSDGLNWEKKTNPYSHHIGGILHETDSSTAMVGTGCERNACKEISIFRCQFVSVFDWALTAFAWKKYQNIFSKQWSFKSTINSFEESLYHFPVWNWGLAARDHPKPESFSAFYRVVWLEPRSNNNVQLGRIKCWHSQATIPDFWVKLPSKKRSWNNQRYLEYVFLETLQTTNKNTES